MIRGEQPAFPEIHIHHWRAEDKEVGETDNVVPRWHGGLTKREYFAAMAMQGIAAAEDYSVLADVVSQAVIIADLLIKELGKESE